MCLIGSSSVNSFGKLYTQGIWLWDYEIDDTNIFQDFNISPQILLFIVHIKNIDWVNCKIEQSTLMSVKWAVSSQCSRRNHELSISGDWTYSYVALGNPLLIGPAAAS